MNLFVLYSSCCSTQDLFPIMHLQVHTLSSSLTQHTPHSFDDYSCGHEKKSACMSLIEVKSPGNVVLTDEIATLSI